MKTRKLSLQEMQMVEGGNKLEIYCGVTNCAIIGSLYFGPAGLISAIGRAAGAYLAGCYERQ